MFSRALASRDLCTVAGVFSLTFVFLGCEGDPAGPVTDASFERPTATGGSGGTGGTGATGGSGATGGGGSPDARLSPDTPPPVPNAASIRILPGQTDLLGSFTNGCTFGPGADRWCAVSRPLSLTRRELWLVNVSKTAANGATALVRTCDVPGLCLTASDNLYTGQPQNGPAYPEAAARASGNTFLFLTDAESPPADPFEGDAWAHTIGAPSITRIGDNVFDCAVSGQRYIDFGRTLVNKVVGICTGSPSSTGETNFFTLLGGVVLGQEVPATPSTVLPTKQPMTGLFGPVQRIFPIHPGTMATRWRSGLTPDGETLAVSTGGATLEEVEKISTIRTDDIGKPGIVPTPMSNGENASRWALSVDAKKIYFLKDYNYNVMGNASGTLTVADFPAGTGVKELKGMRVPSGNTTGVGGFRALANREGLDSGVGFLSGLTAGRGDYSIIKNLDGSMDDAANVVSVAQRSRTVPLPSSNLRFSVFSREFDDNGQTSDIWLAANDGSSTCALSSGTLGEFFGFPFTRSEGMIFWADNYDEGTFAADGWLTEPGDCANNAKKRNFGRGVDFWFVDSDRLLLYSDESNGAQVTLKYAYINGSTLGTPVVIQTRAERLFHIVLDVQPTDGSPPRFKGVTYKLGGGGEEVDGIYYYEFPLQGGAQPPLMDAAAPADGASGG
jgi:hypothetical protein